MVKSKQTMRHTHSHDTPQLATVQALTRAYQPALCFWLGLAHLDSLVHTFKTLSLA